MLSEGTEQVQVGCTQLQSVNSPVRNSWPSCLSTNILHIFCCLSSVASDLWACNQPALCCPKKTISCKDPTLIDAVTLQHMACLAHLGAFFPKPPHKEKVSHAPAVDELRCVQDPDCSAKRHGGNMGCSKKKKKKRNFLQACVWRHDIHSRKSATAGVSRRTVLASVAADCHRRS